MAQSRLVPYCRVTIYESANRFYIVGSDLNANRFCLLKIDRTEGKELVFSNGDHEYTKKELNEVLAMIHGSNAASGKTAATYVLNERIAKANGLLGFVRFLEGYYMVVITKSRKVAQLGYHHIYKIDETEMIYIPSSKSADSHQRNSAEEQRYVKLFQSVDLATDFYFSYTYDLTRTLHSNIASTTSKTAKSNNDDGAYEKFVWNSYLLEPMITNGVNSRWIIPIVHGFLGSCSLSIKGFRFNLLLLARRSNKFAGTRFLKRGANNRGYVANEVETEQIVYDASLCSFERGRFTSFVQLRGSVPLVWSQDLTKVVGKPPIQLDCIDPFAVIPALHFQELRTRYDDPIVVINLVKRRERRRQESVLNDEFRTSISYLNQFLDPREAILYLSFDMARCHKTGNVLPKLEEIGYNAVKLNGWFQTFPPLYSHQLRPPSVSASNADAEDDDRLLINQRRAGRFLLQTGIPRVNCVDCLDRTNVAQFVIGKVALSYQLYALGLLDAPSLSLETEICRILESLYEEHGDTLALQYAGSQLVHSIRTYKKISLFQERSRDVIQTLSRYYSNTFSDYEKQNAINLFLGVYRPWVFPKTHLWELCSDWALHNPFCGSTAAAVMGTSEMDYCAWFELPDDYWKSRLIACRRRGKLLSSSVEVHDKKDEEAKTAVDDEESEDTDHSSLSDYDRYYRTFELTSFDAVVATYEREVVHIDSATSPPTLSAQPFMKLWKKEGNTNARVQRRKSQDGKRISRRKEAARGGGEDTNDQDESSSEEDVAAHSDTEIQYSTPWYGASGAAIGTPSRWEVNVQQQQSLFEDAQMVRNDNKNKITKAYLNLKSAVELKLPSAKDMLKYERFAKLGGAGAEFADLNSGGGEMTDERRGGGDYRVRRFISDTSGIQPLMSIFTSDCCFGVQAPRVSESARRAYENSVRCARRGPTAPSTTDCRLYADHAKQYKTLLLGLST